MLVRFCKLIRGGALALLAGLLVASLPGPAAADHPPERVFVKERVQIFFNGERLALDAPPRVVEGRVLVPFRAIFEAFGAIVMWDGDTETVTAEKGERTIRLRIGRREASVNGETQVSDVAPHIFEQRAMVPLRFVSESLQADVSWHGAAQTVVVSTDDARVTEVWVDLEDFVFDPETVAVPPDRTVRFYLYGAGVQPHTFTIDDTNVDEHVDAGFVKVVEHTFTRSRSLRLVCRYHEGIDMIGTIEVAQP